MVDTDNLKVSPFTDPIRALIYSASGEHVELVIVDGRVVVENRRLVAWDEKEIVAAAWRSAREIWDGFPEYDPKGFRVDERYPMSFEVWDGESQ